MFDGQKNQSYISRIESIDLLRGIVILIMALDHVREFFGLYLYNPIDLAHTSPELFMTRWITNLCAPTFMFLSGISAYLYSLKVSRSTLTLFLIKRGLFLILLEITLISWAWQFKFHPIIYLQVIWALGISMLVLAGLVWLARKWILLFSIILIGAHNLLDNIVLNTSSTLGIFWHVLHISSPLQIASFQIFLIYPVLPWVGVMALGFLFRTMDARACTNTQS